MTWKTGFSTPSVYKREEALKSLRDALNFGKRYPATKGMDINGSNPLEMRAIELAEAAKDRADIAKSELRIKSSSPFKNGRR